MRTATISPPPDPVKLLALVDALSGQFAGFTAGSQAELDDAVAAPR